MDLSSDESIVQLEAQLDGASRALSAVRSLNARDAERVAEKMDRLASQLLDVTAPTPMTGVHERLRTAPASDADFAALLFEMGPADGEG